MKKPPLEFSAINAGQWVITAALRGREKETHQVKIVELDHIIIGRQRYNRRTGTHAATGRKIISMASEADITRVKAFGGF